MPLLRLIFLYCEETESGLFENDHLRLEVFPDEASADSMKELNTEETWLLNEEFSFDAKVEIKLWDEDEIDGDDLLGQHVIGPELLHRGRVDFNKDDAKYQLWFEVVDPDKRHQISEISLRQMLGRLGRGVLSQKVHKKLLAKSIYQCSEVISLLDTFRFHAAQDGEKGNTNSVRTWINRHCNLWDEETVIPETRPTRIG